MITLCRMHGMDSPVCPEKSYEKWIIQEWGKLVPEVYYRGYWFNLADPVAGVAGPAVLGTTGW